MNEIKTLSNLSFNYFLLKIYRIYQLIYQFFYFIFTSQNFYNITKTLKLFLFNFRAFQCIFKKLRIFLQYGYYIFFRAYSFIHEIFYDKNDKIQLFYVLFLPIS
jgi:hypothetical protein